MPKSDLGTLARLVEGEIIGDASIEVADVVHDSRRAGPDTLFVAIPGFTVDGHAFVETAVGQGSPAVCVQSRQQVKVPQLVVGDTRAVLAKLAAQVHGHPSRRLDVVGVTGTNGKTTVTFMLESIATAAGRLTGRIGTIGAKAAGEEMIIERTTPEATDIQRLLADMAERGVEVVAMEVSSHALALGRADEIRYAVAAFTNLSVDHLDFHADMTEYFEAKARLFEMAEAKVVFLSDWGSRLAARHPDAMRVGEGGDVRASQVVERSASSTFVLHTPAGSVPVEIPLPGDFNVDNALIAAACALHLDVAPTVIAAGLAAMPAIPGRMERVGGGQPFGVYVDYAHTPEGIDVAIHAARGFTTGRVIVVVGAGGDRDESKRPLMGAAAAAADDVWVTSDNPRSEDPDLIIQQIVGGLPEAASAHVEPDREVAIKEALRSARPGDTVLILGKGHEQGQEAEGRVVPFDDRMVAAAALEEVGA